MRKQEFLARLRKALAGSPQDDIEERLLFYSEMIDDQMEEGLSEEEAVLAVGTVEEIAAAPAAETPPIKTAKEGSKPKRRRNAGKIVLLILGSPLWLPLGVAAFALLLSLYLVLWAVLVSLWAAFVSLAAGSVYGMLACVPFLAGGSADRGLTMLAAGLVCAGLSIFAFYGCRAATRGVLLLTRKAAKWVKNRFIRKEEAK